MVFPPQDHFHIYQFYGAIHLSVLFPLVEENEINKDNMELTWYLLQ